MISSQLSLLLGALGCLFASLLSIVWITLVNLSRGTVRKLEAKDRVLSERLDLLLKRRDRYRILLRLLLLANLMFIFVCGSEYYRAQADVVGYWNSLLPFLICAGTYLVLTELIGRHLTGIMAARFILLVMPLLKVLGLLVAPFWFPLVFVHHRISSWQEGHSEEEEKATAEDEIMSLVESDAEQDGTEPDLEEDERRMIRGIFDLDETLVREIMTPRVDVDAVSHCATLAEIKMRIVESGHSRIPVYKDSVDHVIGVVYAKDLLDEKRLASVKTLDEILHRPIFLPATKNVGDLLAEFQQSRNHFAVVLDEYGGTAGIITFEDVLEEIVGEIQDEYDLDEIRPTLELMPDGTIEADARTPLYELIELLDVELPEDHDCDTLGGYISASTGHIPQKGEMVENDVFTFEIMDAEPRRVLKARVKKKQIKEDDAND